MVAHPRGADGVLQRAACGAVLGCVFTSATADGVTPLGEGARLLDVAPLGDGLALAWVADGPGGPTARVRVLDRAFEPVLEEALLVLDGETFLDLHLAVVEPAAGGAEIVVAAGVQGPEAYDDRVVAAAVRVPAACE